MEKKLISISTSRYSEFFRRLLHHYSEGTTAIVDTRQYAATDFLELSNTWCINAEIRKTRNFLLTRGSARLFGFHDSVKDIWGVCSELAFVERLAAEGLIRYRIMPVDSYIR